MWDGNPGRNETAQQRIELLPEDPQPIHSSPYRARQNASKMQKNDITQMFKLEVVEPAQTE